MVIHLIKDTVRNHIHSLYLQNLYTALPRPVVDAIAAMISSDSEMCL